MESKKLMCGLEFNSGVPDVKDAILTATESGYDFVCIPLTHPRYKRGIIKNEINSQKLESFTRSDLVLTSKDWANLIIGKLSGYINVDSEDYDIRAASEETFKQELSWATYLCLPSVFITLPSSGSIVNLARIVNSQLKCQHTIPQFLVRVPMLPIKEISSSYREDADENEVMQSTWARWNQFRSLCDWDPKLGVALEITNDLPSDEELDRWSGEPVKLIIIKTKTFISNKKGFPVLCKTHQDFVKSMISSVQFVISGANRHQFIRHYYQYLHFLWQSAPPDRLSYYARGYEDYLQIPLQPLMDNLESHTYETFEKDPVKYSRYQCAIYRAMKDKLEASTNEDITLVVMVVGAGRGPLVSASINASQKANVKVKIYAIEKNPNAVVSLKMKKSEDWKDLVEVIECDMRVWNAPENADILVSELLGSFGDNELSPECLDGAQKFLKDDGVCIPASYTSFICPIQSYKLFSEVKNCRDKDKHPYYHFEQLYVVHQTSIYRIAPIKNLFSFSHPNSAATIDNARYRTLEFDIKIDCVLNGFSGYFETTLYSDISLSIVPENYSDGMFSWFPIYFPIREPIQLKSGDKLKVHFWRAMSKKNVWYEWVISEPVAIPIHNSSGRSYFIGL